MAQRGPWYPRKTGTVGWKDEQGEAHAFLAKGEPWWDARLPNARPELFTTDKAEAMRPDPMSRPCRQCGAIFEVPTGPGETQDHAAALHNMVEARACQPAD
ncbi:hypothetical protein [Micromonospora sp. NPDC005197]|uniref:hypothetical protein n=1 Tax=Micromonospora sp. NPDC005197 TaxID=3157020 RepID=UPI0033A24F85